MTLFIESIAQKDWSTLSIKTTMLLIIYTCVLIAIIIDLISGIRKAKIRGELRTSEGLKRTVDKAVKYYSLLILFTLMDIIASITIGVPYFTMIGGVFIVSIEIKSWFEHANEKEKKGIVHIIKLLRKKDDLVDALADALEEEDRESKEKTENREDKENKENKEDDETSK